MKTDRDHISFFAAWSSPEPLEVMDLCRTSLEQITKQSRISRANALLLLQYSCNEGDGVCVVVSFISVVLCLESESCW